MREVWRWGINPKEPAYKRTILLMLIAILYTKEFDYK